MKIRFTQPTHLSFIVGLEEDGDDVDFKLKKIDFQKDQELETFMEQNGRQINFICSLGMVDRVPADCFQILSLKTG